MALFDVIGDELTVLFDDEVLHEATLEKLGTVIRCEVFTEYVRWPRYVHAEPRWDVRRIRNDMFREEDAGRVEELHVN